MQIPKTNLKLLINYELKLILCNFDKWGGELTSHT